MSTSRQGTLDAPSAATVADLRYAGEQGALAVYYAVKPGTRTQCKLTYDRATGQATATPPSPELAALAGFATLVLDEHAKLRQLRLDDRNLARMTATIAQLLRTLPDDELTRAMLAACEREAHQRRSQGPDLAAAARDDSPEGRAAVRRLAAADLFGDGC